MPTRAIHCKELKLTNREFLFADAILRGLDNINAYKESSPTCKSEKAASVAASRMLSRPSVQSYINQELARREERRRKEIEVDDLWITKQFKEVYERCMQRAPVMEFNRESKSMQQATDEEGNHLWTFDSTGANRALENIAKHIGYYELDNKQRAPVIQVAIVQNNFNTIDGEGEEEGGYIEADTASGSS